MAAGMIMTHLQNLTVTGDLIVASLGDGPVNWGQTMREILVSMVKRIERQEAVLFSLAKELPQLQELAPETYRLLAEISMENMKDG